jgi:hypothetical protein
MYCLLHFIYPYLTIKENHIEAVYSTLCFLDRASKVAKRIYEELIASEKKVYLEIRMN